MTQGTERVYKHLHHTSSDAPNGQQRQATISSLPFDLCPDSRASELAQQKIAFPMSGLKALRYRQWALVNGDHLPQPPNVRKPPAWAAPRSACSQVGTEARPQCAIFRHVLRAVEGPMRDAHGGVVWIVHPAPRADLVTSDVQYRGRRARADVHASRACGPWAGHAGPWPPRRRATRDTVRALPWPPLLSKSCTEHDEAARR